MARDPEAEARGRPVAPDPVGQERMLERATERLGRMHDNQVHREPWPDVGSFVAAAYDEELRRHAALQWAGRARAEHGSIHQFSALTHALAEARAPLAVLGALTRLQTDEVRHAELCAAFARAIWPGGSAELPRVFSWPVPRAPWPDAPRPGSGDIHAWAARAVLTACCLGETLSRPMLEAIATVATDPVAEAIARQILRDEHLHATFGWELLDWLWPRLDGGARRTVQDELRTSLGAFERTTCCGIAIEDVAGSEVVIERGTEPNLGTLTDHQYAMIFYATLESNIFPALRKVGLDPEDAWARRGEA